MATHEASGHSSPSCSSTCLGGRGRALSGPVRLVSLLAIATSCVGAAATSGKDLILGISYGPVPLLSPEGASQLPQDDWMADEAVAMYGRGGRGDLFVMKQLGANLVRLYGNNPNDDHTNFLDAAWYEGLSIATGMSDWPYYQMVPGRCEDSNYICFDQVKELYAQNLAKGFLTVEKKYHPALKYMNILNEADLKMPPTATTGDAEGPILMCRAIISAFDAMLEAEKEAGVTGALINFTSTFSYAVCRTCEYFPNSPAIGQIAQLHDAMHNPEKYGYVPKNDLAQAYAERFTHSFNTANPATDLESQFLNDYEATFQSTPVYIGEYHRPNSDQVQDLMTILDVAKRHPLFLGISFFEFQVAYWKAGSEMDFGMFGLKDTVLVDMPYSGKDYQIHCLSPQDSPESHTTLPAAVAQVYGGPGLANVDLCAANPWGVPISQDGFAAIAKQKNALQMQRFTQRIVERLGATVKTDKASTDQLQSFAATYALPGKSFADMAAELGGKPWWVQVSPKARCVADRTASPVKVAQAIEWVCEHAKSFSCAHIPDACANNTYKTADYVLSRYYQELGAKADPLSGCNASGAAAFAPPEVYMRATGASKCVEGAANLAEEAANNRVAGPHRDAPYQPHDHDGSGGAAKDIGSTTVQTSTNSTTGTASSTTTTTTGSVTTEFLAMSGAEHAAPRMLHQWALVFLLALPAVVS